ncbi:MAG: sulfotransferase [Planctomycetota bacterium]
MPAASDRPNASLFLILGSGRCGSTWLYEVLREHPEIALSNEARVFDFLHFCVELVNVPETRIGHFVTREDVHMRGIVGEHHQPAIAKVFTGRTKEAAEDFYRELFPKKKYRWFGDKLPDPRAALTAMNLWPDYRYLILVRDPRDVLCSWRAYAKRDNIKANYPELIDLTAPVLARSWSTLYAGLLERVANPLVMRYEDTVAEPRHHIEQVLAFLGLEWHKWVERALETGGPFRTHGTAPTPESSRGRWQRELSEADVAVIEEVCGELMQRFDYL